MVTPAREELKRIIRDALAEDIGSGDVTTNLLVPAALTAVMRFNAREPLVMAGGQVAAEVFYALNEKIDVIQLAPEGARVSKGDTLIEIRGLARNLLTGERVALNLLQRMCSVATITWHYVEAVAGTKVKILDTRKTMPGLRVLDKYAVECGGGLNHRFGLYDAVLIKDNHIALIGDVEKAILKAWESVDVPVIVECDTLDQVKQALGGRPDRILLDNMSLEHLRAAVKLAGGTVALEASGGITLENVKAIAETGVNFISVGAITHSAPAVDIGADIVFS